MKKIFGICLAFLFVGCAQAVDRITATVTITNAPTTNGMSIQFNSDLRTWTNSTTGSPATTILTNAAIGGVTTNLWTQVVTYPIAGSILPQWVATNQLKFIGTSGGALAVTISGPWASVSYATSVVTSLTAVRVPISGEPTASTGTNIASLLVTGIGAESTNQFSETAYALGKYISTNQAQAMGNKVINSSTLGGSNGGNRLTNLTRLDWVAVPYGQTNYGLDFLNPSGSVGFRIRSDTNGYPAIYIVSTNTTTHDLVASDANVFNFAPSDGSILNRGSADFRYGQLGAANAWTATNTFAQITNTPIKNATLTDTTSQGALTVNESIGFDETIISSLANGGNAAVPIGTSSWIRLTAGPTGAFSIDGVVNGGKRDVWFFNDTGQNMTINNESGTDPVSTNRIVTATGGAQATTGNGVVHLRYSKSKSRWVLMNIEQ